MWQQPRLVDPAYLADALRSSTPTPGQRPLRRTPPATPPDEIIADWRAEQEERRRLEAGLDAEDRSPIDLLAVGVTLLSRLLGK
jgi:hypothetical protein